MTWLWTEVASLWDKWVHKGPDGNRLARWAISPLDESIPKNTNEKVNDFNHDHSLNN